MATILLSKSTKLLGILKSVPLIKKLYPLDLFLIKGRPSQEIALPIFNKIKIK